MPELPPELNPPARILLGPGPSNVHPRVYQAMMAPVLGHLDPDFLRIMDETKELLRTVFRTQNEETIAVSGTGSAGMEAAVANLIEPGERAVVCINGYFGERIAEIASRYGAEVMRVEAEWGHIIEPEAVEAALKAAGRTKLVAIVHAETSTGVSQPLADIVRLAHQHDAFLLVDAVTSLAGCQVAVDDWGIDACYSASQKCLSCPPGLAPLTLSPQAGEAVRSRETKVRSWYLDVTLLDNYWGGKRAYHHTAPITMVYALREGLRLAVEEGLEARIARHRRHGEALWAGLEAMGLALHAPEGHRLPVLTTVRIPEGIDDLKLRRALLYEHSIEIGGGLGPLAGKVWRIGLMGHSSSAENVLAVLAALEHELAGQGYRLEKGAGVAAADRVLES
ncbi:MAG: alanine--glyoxylate aminotransferase family protein [Chloroflexota bacterium]|nr:alanine--glyoxylate aminotransferase family protein [Chloroflexota bacterium]